MVRVKDGVLQLDKEANGRIWVMTLNRPERLNSFNGELRKALYETYWEFAHDDEAWVSILTGNGRAFCTGQDLKERTERNAAAAAGLPDPMVQLPDYLKDMFPLSEKINCWKPMIAAINGLTIAGGFNQAMQCDVRIASSEAEFGIAEVRWNQGAGWVHHLPKIIGLGNALELTLWGDERITAQRAYDWGFVNKVVDPDDLMPTAMEWAERMTRLAPRSVRNLKEILYRGTNMSSMEAQRYAENLEKNLIGMEDSTEGPSAFSEKRIPEFKNR
jgi:enoyl-CoA hydratase/carnithine racemase